MYSELVRERRSGEPDPARVAALRSVVRARKDEGWRSPMAGVRVVALHFQERLGLVPGGAYDTLVASLRAVGYFDPARGRTLIGDLYGLTHVVLVDSGYLKRYPVPAEWEVEAERLDAALQLMLDRQPRRPTDLDILAEVLVCRKLLRMPRTAAAAAAVQALMDSQAPDGSWGRPEQPLQGRWHHTQVAAMALLPFRDPPRQTYAVF